MQSSIIISGQILGRTKPLTRKSGDLRRGILRLLLNQSDGESLASAKRLRKYPRSTPSWIGIAARDDKDSNILAMSNEQ